MLPRPLAPYLPDQIGLERCSQIHLMQRQKEQRWMSRSWLDLMLRTTSLLLLSKTKMRQSLSLHPSTDLQRHRPSWSVDCQST